MRKFLLAGLLGLAVSAGLLSACGELPALDGRSVSRALRETGDTRLGRTIAAPAGERHGQSGIRLLRDSHDALAARILLARAAERSLDVQYYIWHGDLSGSLLLAALQEAAARGVRVRLLLDDNGTVGLDGLLAALDAHPNIEVRLFNPFVVRGSRIIGYLTDFRRLNRRMHNKSFTADNQATIIGGRNIGDEYFGAADGRLFVDLDALAVGPVVDEVSQDFDRYWASGSAYPAARLLPPADAAALAQLASAASRLERDPAAAAYRTALRQSAFSRDFGKGKLQFEWAVARMISDHPSKGLGQAAPEALLWSRLRDVLGSAGSSLDLVSAYFVPTAAGVDALSALSARGVKLRVLTNALEASDVPLVHAGYAKWRRALLRSGVRLFELRRLSPHVQAADGARLLGSSSSSLHAKTFAVDGSRLFIGSFNFDPRSAALNTEMGFVIDSPALARSVENAFDRDIPALAYEVGLADDGSLYWMERRDGKPVRHDEEPGASLLKRAGVWLMSVLPIDWML